MPNFVAQHRVEELAVFTRHFASTCLVGFHLRMNELRISLSSSFNSGWSVSPETLCAETVEQEGGALGVALQRVFGKPHQHAFQDRHGAEPAAVADLHFGIEQQLLENRRLVL